MAEQDKTLTEVRREPTLEDWGRLYAAAAQIKTLAPWQWMSETDNFGVRSPDTGEIGFVSVMGTLGEHLAVAMYQGARGLYGLLAMSEAEPPGPPPEMLLEIPQLQASFEDREHITKQDRDVMNKLGLKFRGRQAWPHFRSYRPGFMPWYLDQAEARWLTHALEQTLDIAPRFQADENLLYPGDDTSYLVRSPRRSGATLTWIDEIVDVPPPAPIAIPIQVNQSELEYLKRLKPSRDKVEMDIFWTPSTIGDADRPYYAYLLLIVDAKSGMIIGQDILAPLPSLEHMWGRIPQTVISNLARLQMLPGEIRIGSPLLKSLIEPWCKELRVKLSLVDRLPNLEYARASFMSFLGAGF